jgi:hypothetical protein
LPATITFVAPACAIGDDDDEDDVAAVLLPHAAAIKATNTRAVRKRTKSDTAAGYSGVTDAHTRAEAAALIESYAHDSTLPSDAPFRFATSRHRLT